MYQSLPAVSSRRVKKERLAALKNDSGRLLDYDIDKTRFHQLREDY